MEDTDIRWMDEWMDGLVIGWLVVRVDRQIDGWLKMDGQTEGMWNRLMAG